MRRKLGILFLIGVTVLAGTQEAARQFDGLKSSLSELTRAGLWSGLIVYAQPVTDGKLPSPQIYYLIPQPLSVPDAQGAVLVDNRSDNAATPKSEAKNNHPGEEAAPSTDVMTTVAATREVEDAAKSELVLDKMPVNLIASHLVVPPPPPAPEPKLAKKRVYVEVAKNEAFARKFNEHAEVIAKVFVKEFDAAKLVAELARRAAHEQLEVAKLKSRTEAETESRRRTEFKVMRRAARPERIIERIKVLSLSFAEKRMIALPDMSSIGCEKAVPAQEDIAVATPAPAPAAAPVVLADVKIADEPLAAVELAAPAISITTSTSWALGCDSEPEQM